MGKIEKQNLRVLVHKFAMLLEQCLNPEFCQLVVEHGGRDFQ